MHHLAALGELARDTLGQVDGNREPQPGPRPGAHQGVDADHLAVGVDQGAAGVAGVDGGVGLDQVEAFVAEAQAVDVAVQAADDAQGDRALQAVRAAQGDRPVAHLQGLGIPEGGRRDPGATGDAHHGQIGDGVGPHHRAVELTAIGQGDEHRIHRLHDMGVGEHQPPAGVDHHPRALPALPQGSGGIAKQVPQQRVEHGRTKGRAGGGALGVEAHHRRGDAAHGFGHEAVARAHGAL